MCRIKPVLKGYEIPKYYDQNCGLFMTFCNSYALSVSIIWNTIKLFLKILILRKIWRWIFIVLILKFLGQLIKNYHVCALAFWYQIGLMYLTLKFADFVKISWVFELKIFSCMLPSLIIVCTSIRHLLYCFFFFAFSRLVDPNK